MMVFVVFRKVGKRKAAAKPAKSSKIATKKAKKDPNKPKRAPSAFFVFLYNPIIFFPICLMSFYGHI